MARNSNGSTTDSPAAAPALRGDGRAGVEEPARAPIVRVENLHRSYGRGAAAVHALRGVSFEIPRGELVALKAGPGPARPHCSIWSVASTARTRAGSPSTARTFPSSARTACWRYAATASASSSSPSV